MPKTNVKKLPKSQVEVSVALSDEEFKSYYEPVYNEAAAQVTIKGFRKGNAPKEMVAGAVDADKVFTSAIEEAAKYTLDELKKENEWVFVDAPQVQVTDTKNGVAYTATLTLLPEVELGDYKKILKKYFADPIKVEVSEEEKTKALDWLVNSRASETRVTRESKDGDLVEVKITAKADGKEIPGAQFQGDRFILGKSQFMQGFDEKLIGKKEGETTSFSLMAGKDYWHKDLQGKTIDFTVEIKGVFERKVPELNDEFVRSLGPSFQTVADVKKNIAQGMAKEKENKEIEDRQIKAITEISEKAKIEIPDILANRMLDQLVGDMKRIIPPDPKKDPQELDAELRKQMRDQAEKNVATHLVIYKIARDEKLTPTVEEVEREAALLSVDAQQYGAVLYDRIQNRKVFNFLVETGKGEVKKEA